MAQDKVSLGGVTLSGPHLYRLARNIYSWVTVHALQIC